MSDLYYTIKREGKCQYKEKMSRFLGFAYPVQTAEEAKQRVKEIQNEYHDARHVCWAYMLGPERKEWQLNDNGEPSGTAGKPILGQINSLELTNVVVAVVRYFGGIKLGTSGLAEAYREAARGALEDGAVVECHDMIEIEITFPYMSTDKVLRIVKGENLEVLSKSFDNSCSISLRVRKDYADELCERFRSIDGVSL